jgi:hypothetical protein
MTVLHKIGDWQLECRIEMRTQVRNLDSWCKEPPLEHGDVWYRFVFELANTNDEGTQGLFGQLETAWQWGIDAAAEQAKKLRALPLLWPEYDEATDEYHDKVAMIEIAPLVDETIAQFKQIAPIDPKHM